MRVFLVILLLAVVSVGVFYYLNQQDATGLLKQGVAWAQQGEYDKAIAEFTEAIRIEPQNAGLLTAGVLPGEKGKPDVAITDFTEAIRLNPKDAEAFTADSPRSSAR